MHESQSKAPKNGKPAGAGESSCASCGDHAGPIHAQMMPAYALGQGVPGVPLFSSPVQAIPTAGLPNDSYDEETDTTQGLARSTLTTASFARSKDDEEDATLRRIEEEQSEDPEPESQSLETKETIQPKTLTRLSRLEASEEKDVEDEEEEICVDSAQLRVNGNALTNTVSSVIQTKRSLDQVISPRIPKGNEQPFSDEHRMPFERVLNHPFDHVKIHTGSGVDRAARLMNADAFTIGSDIYFSDQAYAPGTSHGDRVLAHELTHVVQHDEGSIPESSSEETTISKPTDPLEVEAYAQEGAIAHDVGALRGGSGTSVVAPAPVASTPIAAPATAAAAPAPPGAAQSAPAFAQRDEGETPNASAESTGAGGEVGPSSFGALIPPVPEQPSPLETTEPVEVPSLADAESSVAPPAEPPIPQTESAPAAGPPQSHQPEVAPELESPATETAWLTAPMDLGVPQPSTEPETGEAPAVTTEPSGTTGNGIAAARAAALEAEVASVAASLEAAGAASLESITSQVAQMTESVHAEAELARARVAAAYDAQRAAVSSEREAALGAINQSRDQQREAIGTFAESERERLHTAKQTEEASATSLAEQLKADALATGESEAQRAADGTEQRAQTILAEAEAVGANGDPTSVEAQREASRRIAQDAADKCRETGNQVASDVREEASLQSGKYDEMLQDFLEKLQQAVDDAEPSIDEFASHATEVVSSRAEQAIAAAEEMASQSRTALDNEQSAAAEQIQAWEDQAITAVSDAANQLRDPLSAEIETLRADLTRFGAATGGQLRSMQDASTEEVEAANADARARLRQASDNAASALAEFDANTATQLNGLFEELRANLTATMEERTAAAAETGARMAQMLRDSAQTAVTGIEEAVSSYREGLSAGMNDSIAEMTDNSSQFRSNLQDAHAEAMSRFATLIDDGLASEDGFLTDARAEMASAVADIASEYETLKAEADRRESSEEAAPATRIHRGIWDTITGWVDSVRHWFADTFGEFWGGLIFGILAGLVMVAVGLLIGWAVGAIVGFFIVSAKVAAIVTIVILLVIAIPLNIYNRFQEFYADHPGEDAGFWRGLGLVGLGIADLTGIPFIIEGIAGQRAFSPHPMTPFEKGERLGMGVVFFGAALVSIKGILRARPRPEIRPTPDPVTGEIPKMLPPSPTRPMADVMQWGNGIEGIPLTRARTGTLTRAELVQGGVTRELATQWRDFYINEAARNPFNPATGRGNPQAAPRADLMRRAVDLLGTVPTTPVPVVPPTPGPDEEDQTQRKPEPGQESVTAFRLGETVQRKATVGPDDDSEEAQDLETDLRQISQRESRLSTAREFGNGSHQSNAVQRQVEPENEDAESGPDSEDLQDPVQPEVAPDGATASNAGEGSAGSATANTAGPSSAFSSGVSHGLRAATRPLPELERIQESFGRHDVSDVQVQVGGPAEQANEQLGARAYTSGNKIAFKQEPDLRLAAHEAAHVVQQRRGVHLKGGIGEAGDPYEQQADRAADAVVAGLPAEPVLDEQAGSDRANGGVQRECECGGGGGDCSACQSKTAEESVQMQLEVTTEREQPEALANGGGGESVAPGTATESARPGEAEQVSQEGAAGESEVAAEEATGAAEESVAQQSETLAATPEAPAETAEVAEPETAEEPADREAAAEDREEEEQEQAGATREVSPAAETAPASERPIQRKQCDPPPAPPDREPEEGEAPPPDPPPGHVEENIEPDGPTAEEQSQGCGAEQLAATLESAAPAEETAAATEEAISSEPVNGEATGGEGGGGATGGQAVGGEAAASGSDQTQAASQGAEANIVQAQDGRAEAVAAYESSTVALGDAGTGATELASFGVHFPKIEGATEVDEKRRSEATQTLEGFLSDGSGRLTDAIAFAQETVPERVGAAAEAAKASVESAAAASSAALTASIVQARGAAVGQAAALSGQVNSAHDATVATIESETLAALDSLDAEYNAAAETIPEIEAEQITTLSDGYAAGDRRYREIGAVIGAEATNRGEYYASHYDGCHIHKKDSFWDGYLTDRRADARMKASRDVAKGYKESLEKEANKQADEGAKGFACDEQAVHRSAAAALATLDSQYQSTVAALISAQGQAIASAGSTRDQLLTSAGQALTSMLAMLDLQEETQLRTITDTKYLQIVTVEQAAHMAAASLQGTILQAANSLGGAMRSLVGPLTSVAAPNPEALRGVLERGTAQVEVGLGNLYGTIEHGLSGVEGQIASHGGQSAAAVMSIGNDGIAQADSASAGFSQTMAGLEKSAADTFGQLTANHVSSVQQMTSAAIAGFNQQVTGLQQSYETLNGSVAGRFEQAATGLEAGLRDSLKGMDSGKDSIPHYADEAASKEAPAWKSIVKWILIIAIILVVALVIGPAVIGAVGAWAGSAFAGAVIGGAIVGAATGAAIQVLNNWETNTTWHEGVGKAALIGAIGGAIGGGAGFLIGKQVGSMALQFGLTKVTTKAIEIGANLASDAVLEIGTQLATTGEVNWSDFGTAMLMSIATAGLGEIPAVKKVQARVQTHVDTKISGAPGAHPNVGAPGVHPEAAGVKPQTEVEGGAPRAGAEPEATAPRAGTEPEATTPRTWTEPEATAPRTEAEVKAQSDAKAEAGKSPRPEGGDTPRLDSDPDMPANQRTDSELAEATTAARIGDEDHGIVPRKMGDQIELWGCSQACGQLRSKIDDMLDALPPTGHEKLRSDLEALKAKVEQAEQRLSGGEKSKEIIAETKAIADHFKALGEQHPSLGKAMNDPKAIVEGEGAETGTPAARQPLDLSEIEAGPRQVVDAGDIKSLKFEGDPDVLYVLRDKKTGAILKVGKTTGNAAPGRLDAYDLAARRLSIELELEVITINTPKGAKVELYEGRLRAQIGAEGHILPWDNTQNRLGHEGPGTPFEPLAGPSKADVDPETGETLPSMREKLMWDEKGNLVSKDGRPIPEWVRKNAAPTKEDIMRLARENKGDIAEMAKATGKAESSIRRLLAEYGIRASDFR